MAHPWDGFFAVYMTGVAGQGFAMFVIAKGKISGADPLGVLFDGTYDESITDKLVGNINVSVPPGDTVIQGASAGPSGLVYNVPVSFTGNPMMSEFSRVETPLGPVNYRLKKVRGADDI